MTSNKKREAETEKKHPNKVGFLKIPEFLKLFLLT